MSDIDLPLAVRMMQDGYLMEIQDLKEKNDQLRRERDFFFQQVTENGERAHGAIDALNAENDKLREERDMYRDLVGCMVHPDIPDQLQAENDKLRELVRDVMPIVCDGCHERLCEMPKEEHPFITCWFADRMFELGIEVD